MIRELSGHDPTRVETVLRVPVREALQSFSDRMKKEAAEGYRHQSLLYVLGGLKEVPKLPTILQPR